MSGVNEGPEVILIPPGDPQEPKPEPEKPVPPVPKPVVPKGSIADVVKSFLASRGIGGPGLLAAPTASPVRSASQAERDEAIRRLRNKGVPLTAVNIAEEIAVGGQPTPVLPVAGPGMLAPAQGGPSGATIEERIRARQAAEQAEEFRRMNAEQQQYVQPRR